MDELNAKLKYVFSDVVVRKDVVLYQKVARLPRFISEYLISSLGKEKPDREDLAKVANLISSCYSELRDRDKVLHDLMNLMKIGEYKVINEIKVFHRHFLEPIKLSSEILGLNAQSLMNS